MGVSIASALRFEHVGVRLGGRQVLRDISFSLVPGEIICLLGDSGSGKSTILRAAAGIQPIDAGEIRVNDMLASAPGVTVSPGKRGVGLMFQDFALFPHMTLLGNVTFAMQGLGRAQAEKQAEAALRRVGLLDRKNAYPHELSGGQQQRLALARAFAPKPGILMLDEPFSSLDARLRASVRGETLAILRETHATTIIVTHDPEEAMLLGDRIALLRDGKIVQIDTARNMFSHPADLQAARFFSPQSEIEVVVNGGFARSPLGDVPTPGRPDGARVILAFRAVGALHILPRTAENEGVPARIVSKQQALGLDIYEIQVQNVDAPLVLRAPADDALPPGTDIRLKIDPDHVLVFDHV